MRKILSCFISFVLMFAMPTCVFAAGIELNTVKSYNQEISVELLDEFLMNYDDSMYGGAYIGDNGQLVINLLEDNAQQKDFIDNKNAKMKKTRSSTNETSKIEMNYVTYSMEFLKEIIEKLYPYMEELGIIGMGIDEMNNCVVIDAEPTFSELKMKLKLTQELQGNSKSILANTVNSELFEISICEGEIVSTATVKGGSVVTKSSSDFTVAWGAIVEFSGVHKGKNVFIVPGHAVSVGDTVKIGGSVLGKVIVSCYGGKYDFAYVENSGNSFVSTLPNGESLPVGSAYSNPPQNLSITAYGGVSGKQTGKVLLTNYAGRDSNGTTYQGMLKTSYRAVLGDSGAPVWSGSPVGMQSNSYLVNDKWVNGTSFSVCTVIANIDRRNSTYDIFIKTF